MNDTVALRALLQEVYSWPTSPSSMRVLTDDPSTPEHLQPTKRNILSSLEWLAADVSPGDALFFSFSGHGAQQEDPQGIEEDGMNETILPGTNFDCVVTEFRCYENNFYLLCRVACVRWVCQWTSDEMA